MRFVDRLDVDPDDWNDFVARHPHGWFWHTTHWLDYSAAYSPDAVDHSFAVLGDDDAGPLQAVVPLLVTVDGQQVCGGQVTPMPLFDPAALSLGIARDVRQHVRLRAGVSGLPIQIHPSRGVPGTPPPDNVRMNVGRTFVADLREDEAAIWARLRKSYKNLIHRGEKQYQLRVGTDAQLLTEYHHLHVDAVGRETRPPRTWAAMAQWLIDGHGIVVLADDANGFVRAGAYVIVYKDWGYYASGASLAENAQHLVQWAAIKALKARGTAFYELGRVARPADGSKAQGIAHFKAGFGGGTVPYVTVHDATN